MSRRIAFFDFDGTITRGDTMLAFIRFVRGNAAFLRGMALQFPWVAGYRLKLISNRAAKERALAWFFGGMPAGEFDAWADRFAKEILPGMVRPRALAEIGALKKAGASVVIVSASADNWLLPWTGAQDCALIATKLAVTGGRITGKLDGPNCRGREKVRRIRAAYDLSAYDEISAYGDTAGDRPMLALASPGHAHYKPFR